MITGGGDLICVKRDLIEEIQESQDARFLIEVFRNGSEEECEAACEKLAKLPITAYQHLINARLDQNDNIRKWVVLVFGKTEDTYFLPCLAHMVDDSCPSVSETVHQVLQNMLNSILSDKNRAANSYDAVVLKAALFTMLSSGCEAARETAYGFMQEFLSEEMLVKEMTECLSNAKGEAIERIKPFYGRAIRDLRLSQNGFIETDKKVLFDKGFVGRRSPTAQAPKKGRKNFAN